MLALDEPQQTFYTWTTLASVAGAAGGALLVGAAAKLLVGDGARKWGVLIGAIAISVGLLFAVGPDNRDAIAWVVAILNALLVFATAIGINQSLSGGTKGDMADSASERGAAPTPRAESVGTSAAGSRSSAAFRPMDDWLRDD